MPILGLSLVVVVPNAGQFSQVESSLNATALGTLVAGLVSQTVSLTLPRFKVETGTSLVTLLQALGMTSAFIPGVADFSGMDGTQQPVHLGCHPQGISSTSRKTVPRPQPPRQWVISILAIAAPTGLLVDATRPFIYFLYDQPTGAILFMGRVSRS